MRTSSVANAKGYRDNPALPRAGSRLRAIYDLFCANKCKVVELHDTGDYIRISQLRDFYGLDIRPVGRCKWCLVGEWFGKVYVDYLADQL